MKQKQFFTRRMILAGAGSAGVLSLITEKSYSLPVKPRPKRDRNMMEEHELMFAMACCLYRRDPRAQEEYRYYETRLAALHGWPCPAA